MSVKVRVGWAPLLVVGLLLFLAADPALAQARNPFSVGISEGGGSASGFTGWILAQQGWFEQRLSATVRAARTDGTALWTLIGVSLAYGVFHAAGPGHGKAVLASYMVANERALRRGMALSFLAALLQGLVAIALVGVLALVLHATAQRMKDAASLIETLSFAGIAMLGLWLVWRKGRAFATLWRRPIGTRPLEAGATAWRFESPVRQGGLAFSGPAPAVAAASRFVCVEEDASHSAGCTHCRTLDLTGLGGTRLPLREAALTVFAAGSRPCSGAILVLVFALAQGVFLYGVAAALAMAIGVAITTAALASLAVLAKSTARRLVQPGSRVGVLTFAGLELAAAVLVLVAGSALLVGYATLMGA